MAVQTHKSREAWLASVLFGLTASSCVLGLPTPSAGPKLERPEPRSETATPRPKDCTGDCRWSPGYWHWDGGGHVWINGHWERSRDLVAESTRSRVRAGASPSK
jgi:hypothetical protein